MPEKLDPNTTKSVRTLRIYRKLLVNGRKYYLPDLAEEFNCSPQTIIKTMLDIEAVIGANLQTAMDGKKRWYRIVDREPAKAAGFHHVAKAGFFDSCMAEPPGKVLAGACLPTMKLGPAAGRPSKNWLRLSALAPENSIIFRYKPDGRSYGFASARLLLVGDTEYALGAILGENAEPAAMALLTLENASRIRQGKAITPEDVQTFMDGADSAPWAIDELGALLGQG